MAKKKVTVAVCNNYGTVRMGKAIPKGAIYGTTTEGIPWVCTDLNLYPDGISIDVFIYDNRREQAIKRSIEKLKRQKSYASDDHFWELVRRLESVQKNQRWKAVRINSGEIHRVLTQFLEENHLFGSEVEYSWGLKGTFQASCPTGKKQKAIGLKEANKRRQARGDGKGVVLDHVGNPYTRGTSRGGLILYW